MIFMDIWLDTTQSAVVRKALGLGIVTGVTTNPSLIAADGRNIDNILSELLHCQEGPVAVQVLGKTAAEMVLEGQNYYCFSNRLVIKVPITQEGLTAISQLSQQGIPTMATALATSAQALTAALAGADYIAPYISRIEKAGEDPFTLLATIVRIYDKSNFKTRILGASLKTVEDLLRCAEIGIYGVTINGELFDKLTEDHPLTTDWMAKFHSDARSIKPCR